jgi:hypothetical protein
MRVWEGMLQIVRLIRATQASFDRRFTILENRIAALEKQAIGLGSAEEEVCQSSPSHLSPGLGDGPASGEAEVVEVVEVVHRRVLECLFPLRPLWLRLLSLSPRRY